MKYRIYEAMEWKGTAKRSHSDYVGSPRKKSKKNASKKTISDPSLLYIDDPLRAPIIDTARKYFANTVHSNFTVYIGPVNGWRTVAKLAVRGYKSASGIDGQTGKIVSNKCIGLFEPGSHQVVPCFHSPVHHPSINKVAKLVEEAFVLMHVTGYREDIDAGEVRYLLFSVQTDTGKVQLTLVVNKEVPTLPIQLIDHTELGEVDPQEPLMKAIKWLISKQKRQKMIHSVWLHFHPTSRHNNAITGRLANSWQCIWGEAMLRECLTAQVESDIDQIQLVPLCPKFKPKLCFPPHVFRQANLRGFGRIIMSIRKFVPKKCRCIELYGGVGTIGLNILDLVKHLQCSDENPYNVDCFETTLSDVIADVIKTKRETETYMHPEEEMEEEVDKGEKIDADTLSNRIMKKYRKRAVYMNSPAKDRALSGDFEHFDLLLVDPPRKGLDVEVVDALLRTHTLQRLIYVSCGFKAFTADCSRILSSGLWKLVHAEGHVLFPGADHIETLAVFDRC